MTKEKRIYIKNEWTNKRAVYRIVNKINGKYYIGSSINLSKSVRQHKKELKLGIHSNIHLQNSYNENGGIKAFDYEVIESIPDDASIKSIQALEQTYLDKHWDDGVLCCNISKIADGPASDLIKKPVVQIDKKSGAIIREWSSTDEAMSASGISGIRQVCKGKRTSAGGFKWKYANEELASKYMENNSTHGGHGKRSVVEIDKDGTIIDKWDSFTEAEKETGIPYPNILGVCAGRGSNCRGRFFRYVQNETSLAETTKLISVNNESNVCLECSTVSDQVQISFKTLRMLATHIQVVHKMKSVDYIVKHFYAGSAPMCLEEFCSNIPRYCSMNGAESFKTYCGEHASLACSIAGKVGGTNKETWNKGLTKATDIRIHNQALSVTGEGNHFFGKVHTDDMKINMSKLKTMTQEEYETRITSRANDFRCLTPYNAYVSRQRTRLNLECVKCSKAQQKTLQAFERGGLCIHCYPFIISKGELDVANYITSLGLAIKRNDRSVISPKELDVYIPSNKFAIEYNGLYWHNELKVGKMHHMNKTEACKLAGHKLFHIFSDEWEYKSDIIKSMLSSRLGTDNITKVDARKCVLVQLTGKEAKPFFDTTHISGHVIATRYFGLKYKDELVAAISWRSPQQKAKWREKNANCVEIARYSNKLYTNVRGGFSRLLKHSINFWITPETNYKTILSYCDLRFGYGNVYLQSGFVLDKKDTGINYWYTDGKVRYPRFKFRATKDKTEKQVADDNKVWKVFGCSNAVYKLELE